MQGAEHMVFAGQWGAKQGGDAMPGDLEDEPLDPVDLRDELGKASIQHVVHRFRADRLTQRP